ELRRLESTRRPRKEGLDELEHLLLADGAHDAVLDAPLGHDHERRHALDAQLLGDGRRLVDVDLDDLGLARDLAGQRLDLRSDRLAGLAPLGGKLDENGDLAAQDHRLEIALGDVRYGRGPPGLRAAVAASFRAAQTPATTPAPAEPATENRHRLRDLYARA